MDHRIGFLPAALPLRQPECPARLLTARTRAVPRVLRSRRPLVRPSAKDNDRDEADPARPNAAVDTSASGSAPSGTGPSTGEPEPAVKSKTNGVAKSLANPKVAPNTVSDKTSDTKAQKPNGVTEKSTDPNPKANGVTPKSTDSKAEASDKSSDSDKQQNQDKLKAAAATATRVLAKTTYTGWTKGVLPVARKVLPNPVKKASDTSLTALAVGVAVGALVLPNVLGTGNQPEQKNLDAQTSATLEKRLEERREFAKASKPASIIPQEIAQTPNGPLIPTPANTLAALKKAMKPEESGLIVSSSQDSLADATLQVEVNGGFNRLRAPDQRLFTSNALTAAKTFDLTKVTVLDKSGAVLATGGVEFRLADQEIRDRAEISALRKEVDRLKNESQEYREEALLLTGELGATKDNEATIRQENDTILVAVRKENRILIDQVKDLEAEVAQSADRNELEKRVVEAEDQTDRLSDAVETLGSQVAKARQAESAALAGKKEALAEVEATKKESAVLIASAQRSAEERVARIENEAKVQIRDIRKAGEDSLATQKKETEVVVAQFEEQMKSVQGDLQKAQNEADSRVATVQKELDQFQTESTRALQAAEKQSIADLGKSEEAKKKAVESVRAENQQTITGLESKLAQEIKERDASIAQAVKEAKAETSALEKQLSIAVGEKDKATEAIQKEADKRVASVEKELNANLGSAKQESAKLLSDTEKAAQKNLEAAQKETLKAEKALEKATKASDAMKEKYERQIAALTDRLEKAGEKLESDKPEIPDLAPQ